MSNSSITSVAYPTIGVVLLGGIANEKTRTPLHTSAGIAYTDSCGSIRTESTIYGDSEMHIYFNGTESKDENRSVKSVLERYRNELQSFFGKKDVSYSSLNYGILSGSSDAGAASIGAILSFIDKKNDIHDIENDIRMISESAGRSLHGGLTITWSDGYSAYTERVLGPEHFNNYAIVGFSFDYPRNPSDTIHQNIIKSKRYKQRTIDADEHAHEIKEMARTDDIEGIFEKAEEDTEEYHSILREVGVLVIRENMQKLIEFIKILRKEFWNSYIVTGGSNVYVIVRRDDLERLIHIKNTFGSKPKILNVAGPAWIKKVESD
ncbi:TVG0327166 [Thermoplasma volcanium GSS1]|uniref:TVG0327166 protein n=1 Tax=Thermoplasma volcanium (strain ATCC 51530 / DSM 4299 / JCM 9571 / NBRC 15438 / GSS1) TaxID=273116 RepID=Q97BY2_THEVO|nr:mevalonate-3-kinase [Thermoplasma volcanium]BAB59465.1 TVG0327166 [Thermoplasma volcanium GSS1]